MNTIPAFGLGTFRLKDQQVIDSVTNGLDLGYRHIDTAQIYGNEADVGKAIAASGVARKDLFVTTKICPRRFPKAKSSNSSCVQNLKNACKNTTSSKIGYFLAISGCFFQA